MIQTRIGIIKIAMVIFHMMTSAIPNGLTMYGVIELDLSFLMRPCLLKLDHSLKMLRHGVYLHFDLQPSVLIHCLLVSVD